MSILVNFGKEFDETIRIDHSVSFMNLILNVIRAYKKMMSGRTYILVFTAENRPGIKSVSEIKNDRKKIPFRQIYLMKLLCKNAGAISAEDENSFNLAERMSFDLDQKVMLAQKMR